MIDPKGAYTETIFKGKKGTWMLIGSKANGNILDTIDTFKCLETGEYIEIERNKLKNYLFLK